VRIEQTFNASLLSNRASRGSGRAVIIRFASVREDASSLLLTLGSAKFGSSPVGKGAVSISGTFYAASTFNVAIRSTVIIAVVVGGTERHTGIGNRIAVRLVRNFTTIETAAFLARWASSTSITTTISTTVRSSTGAIGILLARSAHTSCNIASGLSGNLTTIKGSAVSVGKTSLARLVGLAVLTASGSVAARVIISVLRTLVRITTNSVVTNGVRS